MRYITLPATLRIRKNTRGFFIILYIFLKDRRPFGVPVVIRVPQFGKPLASAVQ
jgi:hypothetical protein